MHETGIASPVSTSRPPRAADGLLRPASAIVRRVLVTSWIPSTLVLVTFLVFSPALRNGFVDWDDHINLVQNLNYRGLGWTQIRWMLTSTLMGHYIPLTWLSFGLDYVLWGMNPFGYHLTNTLVHAGSAALLYLVAVRLLSKATSLAGGALKAGAAMATLFFALHPLRVESVAWVTERRDVLSAFFFLLTVFAYLEAAAATGRRKRWLAMGSVAAYVLALASKSIVMTLPLVLVLLDFYPLGRLQWRWAIWREATAKAVLREKVPYLVLGLLGGVTAYVAVRANDFLTSLDKYPWPARIGMALYSLWFYVEKTVLPVKLSLLYELPAEVRPLAPPFLMAAGAVAVISVLTLALHRRWPAGLAIWVYYGIVLGPVTGIVHSGFQLTNDRYSYLSCLGWALLVGAAVGSIVRLGAMGALRPWLVRAAGAVAAAWIFALATLTWYQVQAWKNTETLWLYAVQADPQCAVCQTNLGDWHLKLGLYDIARGKYELALRLRPSYLKVHANLGLALAETGDPVGAMRHLELALAKYPEDKAVLNNMGTALISLGRPSEAIGYLQRILQIDPNHVPALTNLGVAVIKTGRPEAALTPLLRAAKLRPEDPLVRLNLARAYLALGMDASAREQYEVLTRVDPRRAQILTPAFSSVW